MVLNAKKCHYMCFRIRSENNDFIFDGIKLRNSWEEKIGIIIDNELKFDPHIRNMCKKNSAKIGSAKQNILIMRP